MIEPKAHVAAYHPFKPPDPPRIGRVVRLGRNEWTIPYPEDAMQEMLARISPEDLVAIPELEGLYDRMCAYLGLERDRVLLWPGSDAGIKAVFEVYVEGGDEVVVVNPTYHRYEEFCALYGARRIPADYAEDLGLDVEALARSIGDATKLVVLVNPNSTTGTALEAERILWLTEQARAHDALVLVDEAYHHYCEVTVVPHVRAFDNLIVTRSLSKGFGIAGARVGALAADPRIVDELSKVKPRHEVAAVSARLAEYVLDHPEIMERYVASVRESKRRLPEALEPLGFTVMPSESVSVLIRLPDGVDRSRFVAALAETGYEVGSYLLEPFTRYIRVSVGPWDQMEGFVAACARSLEALAAEPVAVTHA
jgi:histidinol-phosphate aminotransferase